MLLDTWRGRLPPCKDLANKLGNIAVPACGRSAQLDQTRSRSYPSKGPSGHVRLLRDRRSVAHEKPPPTAIVSPVIQPEAADARNTATDAMSCGCPRRPSGVRATISFSKSLPMIPKLCTPSVSTPPGLIALTRIFLGPSSFASTRVIVSTAPLVAE